MVHAIFESIPWRVAFFVYPEIGNVSVYYVEARAPHSWASCCTYRLRIACDFAPPLRQLPDGLETTDLGCFRDSRADRVFERGILGQGDMTSEVSLACRCSSLGCQSPQLLSGALKNPLGPSRNPTSEEVQCHHVHIFYSSICPRCLFHQYFPRGTQDRYSAVRCATVWFPASVSM